MGEGESHIMEKPPRPPGEAVLTRDHWLATFGWATLMAGCVLLALCSAFYGLGFDSARAVTVSFLTLAFAKLWFVFNLRSPGSRLLNNDIARNPYIAGSILLCALLLVAAVYVPSLSNLLQTRPVGLHGWTLALAMSLIPALTGQVIRIKQSHVRSA
jgi:Ca2+-transporting ATPase